MTEKKDVLDAIYETMCGSTAIVAYVDRALDGLKALEMLGVMSKTTAEELRLVTCKRALSEIDKVIQSLKDIEKDVENL